MCLNNSPKNLWGPLGYLLYLLTDPSSDAVYKKEPVDVYFNFQICTGNNGKDELSDPWCPVIQFGQVKVETTLVGEVGETGQQ